MQTYAIQYVFPYNNIHFTLFYRVKQISKLSNLIYSKAFGKFKKTTTTTTAKQNGKKDSVQFQTYMVLYGMVGFFFREREKNLKPKRKMKGTFNQSINVNFGNVKWEGSGWLAGRPCQVK